MRNVKPIDIDTLSHPVDATFATTHKPSSDIDHMLGYGTDLMREYFEQPVSELDAIATLLYLAEGGSNHDLRGYDIATLNQIMLHRIRTLARICRDRVSAIAAGEEPSPDGTRD